MEIDTNAQTVNYYDQRTTINVMNAAPPPTPPTPETLARANDLLREANDVLNSTIREDTRKIVALMLENGRLRKELEQARQLARALTDNAK